MKTLFFLFALLLGGGIAISTLMVALSVLVVAGLAIASRWIPVIYNVRSLGQRRVTTFVTVLGMALVVFVFSTVLMLLQGIKTTLGSAGQLDNVVVLRKGALTEVTSSVSREQAKLIGSLEEVALDGKDGKPLVDAQLSVLIFAQRPGGGDSDGTNVTVRGVSEKTLALHPNARIASGRLFQPGTSEIVIGRALVGRIVGAQLGSQITFARRSWSVVGIIDASGSSFDSEIWGDVEQFMEAFQRTSFSALSARLRDPGTLSQLAPRVAQDPRLSLDVKQERKYFEDLANGTSQFLGFVGIFVAVVFSFGATLGAMISMYAQVAARTREVGTLRAIGFRQSSVLVSFVLESLLLGLLSGGLGVAGSALMQLASFSTMNFATFAEVTFRFTLTPSVIGWSLLFASLMGYVGGLLPALRAARMSIVQAARG